MFYLIGFVAGIIKFYTTLIIAIVLSVGLGLFAQIDGVAENVKETLWGWPVIVVPVATAVLGAFGYLIRLGYDKYMGRE